MVDRVAHRAPAKMKMLAQSPIGAEKRISNVRLRDNIGYS
jgi:hypothetical protein